MSAADAPRLPTRLDRFFFAPANPLTVGITRVGLAVLLWWSFRSNASFALSARLDHPLLRDLYANVFLTDAYGWLSLGVILLLGAGVLPRAAGFLLLVLLAPLALHLRAISVRYIALCLLLAFVWMRSDARLSVSSWWRARPAPPAGPMWPIRLMQLQVSLIYAVNALAKSTPDYLSGDVLVALAATLPNFQVDLSDGYLRVWGFVMPVWLAAPASTAAEWILAVGLWIPGWRALVAAFGVFFHVLLKSIVRIGGLDHVTMALYALFFLRFEQPFSSPSRSPAP